MFDARGALSYSWLPFLSDEWYVWGRPQCTHPHLTTLAWNPPCVTAHRPSLPNGKASAGREKRLAEVCAASAAAVVERARARAVAARNERRFSAALESSVVPFTILTPVRRNNGRILDFVWTYGNPAAARAMGREMAELMGRSIGTVLPRA